MSVGLRNSGAPSAPTARDTTSWMLSGVGAVEHDGRALRRVDDRRRVAGGLRAGTGDDHRDGGRRVTAVDAAHERGDDDRCGEDPSPSSHPLPPATCALDAVKSVGYLHEGRKAAVYAAAPNRGRGDAGLGDGWLRLVAVVTVLAATSTRPTLRRRGRVRSAGACRRRVAHRRPRPARASRSQPDAASIGPLLVPEWTFDANAATGGTNNEITGYPIVVGGCVFIGSSTGNDDAGAHLPGWVFALDAATGEVVWKTPVAGGVYATIAVDGDVVYAHVSVVSGPRLVALDRATGAVLWETVVDTQPGSDAVSSPIPYDGMVWVGVSGTAAEGDEADRLAFQGSTVLVAAEPLDVDVRRRRRALRARRHRPPHLDDPARRVGPRATPAARSGGRSRSTPRPATASSAPATRSTTRPSTRTPTPS